MRAANAAPKLCLPSARLHNKVALHTSQIKEHLYEHNLSQKLADADLSTSAGRAQHMSYIYPQAIAHSAWLLTHSTQALITALSL